MMVTVDSSVGYYCCFYWLYLAELKTGNSITASQFEGQEGVGISFEIEIQKNYSLIQ